VEGRKTLMMELALALMPALDDASAEFLFKVTVPFLVDESGAVQKRAYKTLQALGVQHTALMQARLPEVQEHLVGGLSELAPAAGKWRVRCVAKLVEHLPFDVAYMRLIGAVLGEVILGTKSAARKTRECAFSVLVCMAQKIDAGSAGQQLGDFFSMLLAGLAGTTPHMVSATVLALSRLVYEYAERVGVLAPALLSSVMLLFEHKSREIVTSALGFAKVAAVSLSPDLLREHLQPVIEKLLLWSGDSRNRFRLKVKVILERLIRRISYDEVLEATPEEHRKFILAIQKRLKRAKALKGRARAAGGAEDGEEGAEGAEGGKYRIKGGYEQALYGEEDEEEDEEDEAMGDAAAAAAAARGGGHAGQRRGLEGEKGGGEAVARGGAGQTRHGFPAGKGGLPVILDDEQEARPAPRAPHASAPHLRRCP
jgi:ribosomal RNA-processing protein 12